MNAAKRPHTSSRRRHERVRERRMREQRSCRATSAQERARGASASTKCAAAWPWPRAPFARICLFVALLVPAAQAGEESLPRAARAALVVHPSRVKAQPAAAFALGIPWVVRAFQSYAIVAEHGEHFTVLVVGTDSAQETVGLASGSGKLDKAFEALRGAPAGKIAGHDVYSMPRSPDRIALVGTQQIFEGSSEALRRALDHAPADPARRELEQSLMAAPARPAAATLLVLSAPEETNLVEILHDLDAIWRGLDKLAAPYQTPMKMLGDLRGARADIWQEADSVHVRALLVSTGELDAKRALVALRTARQLAPLASDAAVRSGSLTKADAELLLRTLESMRSRVEDDQVHVDLSIDAASLLPGGRAVRQ